MSKPTPQNSARHEAKRLAERKLQRTVTSAEWDKRKAEIRKRVLEDEKKSKTQTS